MPTERFPLLFRYVLANGAAELFVAFFGVPANSAAGNPVVFRGLRRPPAAALRKSPLLVSRQAALRSLIPR